MVLQQVHFQILNPSANRWETKLVMSGDDLTELETREVDLPSSWQFLATPFDPDNAGAGGYIGTVLEPGEHTYRCMAIGTSWAPVLSNQLIITFNEQGGGGGNGGGFG